MGCLLLVCIRVRFLDQFNGVFSLYSSIKPLLFIFTRNPLHCLPLFSEQIRSLQLFAQKTINPQPGPASPGTPAAGWAQLCHWLTCPWLQRSGGEQGQEVGAGSGYSCGPATAVLSEHHFAWKEPAGAAAVCRRAEGSPYAFAGGLIDTGGLRAKIELSVKRQSLDLGGKWHPALHRIQSLMSRAVLGSERGGDGGAERCSPGSSRGGRSEAASSSRLCRGLCSHLVSAGRRNLETVWEAVVSNVGG